jgi:hypothetical protein
MRMLRRKLLILALGGSTLLATGCADDNLAKGVMVVGGAVGGAYLGSEIAGRKDRKMGTLIGAGVGAGLGLALGGLIQ